MKARGRVLLVEKRNTRSRLVTAEEQEDKQHCQFLAGGVMGPRLSGYLVR